MTRKKENRKPSGAAASPAARTGKPDYLRLLDLLDARGARNWHNAVPIAGVVKELGEDADYWFHLGRNLHSSGHFAVCVRRDESTGREERLFIAEDDATLREYVDTLEGTGRCLMGEAQLYDDMRHEYTWPKGQSEDDDDASPPVKAGRRVRAA